MLSFIKFARLASQAFRRSDRRRSKLTAYRAAEVFEERTVLTVTMMDPTALVGASAGAVAVTPPTAGEPTVMTMAQMSSYINANIGSNTVAVNPPVAGPIYTDTSGLAASDATPSIKSITVVVNQGGTATLTIELKDLKGGETLSFSGACSVTTAPSVSNGSNTVTVTISGSGYGLAQLKDSSGNNVGSAYAILIP